MSTKSDLILDYSSIESALPAHSPTHIERTEDGFIVISSSHREYSYSTVKCEKIWEDTSERRRDLLHLLAKLIRRHCEDTTPKSILVVGLGSSSLTSDSLGTLAAARVIANPELSESPQMPKVSVISPGVPAKTGIDTADIVRAIVERSRAELIITIDSLCATSPERLCKVVQITDCGITPGSALGHSSTEISQSTMPCPVVSIGVPTVIHGSTLSGDTAVKELLVSPADADVAVDCYASLIGGAINSFLLEILRDK